jgi:hypothetical protein
MSATSTPPDDQVETMPRDPSEIAEQEHFDAVVDRDSRIVLSILAAIGIVAAIGMSAAALVKSSGSQHPVTVTAAASAPAGASAPAAPTHVIDVTIEPESKLGPDGKKHDAYSVTNFDVKVGQPTELRIDNKDEGTHSITSPLAGVSIIAQPGVHTYTMLVQKAGRFEWKCIIPCDTGAGGWAMDHPGYMAGYITAS